VPEAVTLLGGETFSDMGLFELLFLGGQFADSGDDLPVVHVRLQSLG
jgi:hypothetical protein